MFAYLAHKQLVGDDLLQNTKRSELDDSPPLKTEFESVPFEMWRRCSRPQTKMATTKGKPRAMWFVGLSYVIQIQRRWPI